MKVDLRKKNTKKERMAYIRGYAVGLSMTKMKTSDIAKLLKVSRRSIQRWKTRHYEKHFVNKSSSGRKCKTSTRSNRLLIRLAHRNKFSSAKELLNLWQERLSVQTIYNRLRAAGLRKRKPFIAPCLTKEQRSMRMKWAMRKCVWREVWNTVIFSDECRFRRMRNDRRIQVWRKEGERMKPENCKWSIQSMGGSIHVWGAIWYGGRSQLTFLKAFVTGKTYINTLMQFFNNENTPMNYIFQDDNAPAHRSSEVEVFHRNRNTRRIKWPSRSPDLNPIEHVWDLVKRKISKRGQIESLIHLELIVKEEWAAVPQETIDGLILSMPRRIRNVILCSGGPTHY